MSRPFCPKCDSLLLENSTICIKCGPIEEINMKYECKHIKRRRTDGDGVETCLDCHMTRRNEGCPWMPDMGREKKMMIKCEHEHTCTYGNDVEVCQKCNATKQNSEAPWMPGTCWCLHKNPTYFPGKNKFVCFECNHELKDGSAKWEPIMAVKCSGCQEITTVPPGIHQGNKVFCPACVPQHCDHRNATFSPEDRLHSCPDCYKRRNESATDWIWPQLMCSDCKKKYDYKGRVPIPDFYQPRCLACLKIVGAAVAKVLFKPKTWDQKFFGLCDEIATWSKDQSTQLGCVIIGPDHEIRSVGYNGLPRGCNDNIPERQERPLKYRYFAHAEENAIANAARIGTPLKGCIIYCQWPPCDRCARMIIGAGIGEVKCQSDEIPIRRTTEVIASMEMIIESNVIMFDAGKILKELKKRGVRHEEDYPNGHCGDPDCEVCV